MFSKDDAAKQDIEIGSIIKKVIIGGAFLLVLPIAVPAITGVDIINFCTVDANGACIEPDIDGDEGAGKLKAGFDKLRPILAVGLDIFFVILGIAILVGPGKQVWAYKLALPNVRTR